MAVLAREERRQEPEAAPPVDLLIVGGGINGAGIARDAAGRGLSVLLVEQDDLAAHTSSASTKLIHGGLRYLEQLKFRLVRESLIERERLLGIAPHIIRPLTFVLPHRNAARPAWMIRIGLLLYDHLGGRKRLRASSTVRLADSPYGAGLDPRIRRGFVYSDCCVDDARLVILNAVDAVARGADIRTRTRVTAARREGDLWEANLLDRASGRESMVRARAIVNATGPWVGGLLTHIEGAARHRPVRLVKGSHIIVPRRFEGEHAFILQNPDGRVVFAIPYERDFTLIGTTDTGWTGDPSSPNIAEEEIAYLCESVNRYLARPTMSADIIHSYSGVRALYDDGSRSASEVTRDYVLELASDHGPQILSVIGGKITTYRRLAEHALEKLARFLPPMSGPWTAASPLPGGDIPEGRFDAFLADARARWPFLPQATVERLVRAHGTRIEEVIGDAKAIEDLGEDFGEGLSEREISYLVAKEWARTVEDIIWRRSKLGLRLKRENVDRIANHLARAKAFPEHIHG